MRVTQVKENAFREAEASCSLEGLDASGDALYQSLKLRVIAGELDADEMIRLLLEDSKGNSDKAAMHLAAAG